jgi:hypothetical protein
MNLFLRWMNVHIDMLRVDLKAELCGLDIEVVQRSTNTNLRYTKGEAPFGKMLVYTASTARFMREDSTRRSGAVGLVP